MVRENYMGWDKGERDIPTVGIEVTKKEELPPEM